MLSAALLAQRGIPNDLPPGDVAGELSGDLRGETVEAQDWLAAYRAFAQPRAVGRRLWLDPREPEESSPPPEGRIPLRPPAREAFGTGSHESTRLALVLLEEVLLEDGPWESRTNGSPGCLRVLDVGSGTGVLAFAALALGAARAVGVEIDPVAALLSGQNRRWNCRAGAGDSAFIAGELGCLAGRRGDDTGSNPPFDLAVVNILPERFRPHLDLLAPLLAPGGGAIFSGILVEQRSEILERLEQAGFSPLHEKQEGEWIAFLCRSARAGSVA